MNAADITLPELTDARRDEIEATLFARISDERSTAAITAAQEAEHARARAVRRGRVWMGTAAAAAFVAVAAVIAPSLAASSGSGSVVTAEQPATMEGSGATSFDSKALSGGAPAGAAADTAREVISTASASVTAVDTRAAIDEITAAASAAGGYVESLSLGGNPVVYDTTGGVAPALPTDPIPQGAWITVRVPADALSDTIADLAQVGEVTATQVDRRDVTTETVDLRARVTSLEASVTRLTELMGQATSTSDLIAAESALAERQGELDSLRQQLTWLDGQVAMSSLTVTVTGPAPATSANPAGFGDGVNAGWNGLVATLNGLVVAIGFLLPWVGVAAVVVLVVWVVRRIVRRRAHARADSPDPEA
ncbi:MAG: DUF4349 domain-containing protein [Microbacterium sp.]|nr:DUF4349 domain-containing protein [Microbacterium sp.]